MKAKPMTRLSCLLAAMLAALLACRAGAAATPPPSTAVPQESPPAEGATPGAAEPQAAETEAQPEEAVPAEGAAAGGNWLVLAASTSGSLVNSLWAVREDLSDVRPLIQEAQIAVPYDWHLDTVISPDGQYLAYLTTSVPTGYLGLTLNLVHLPDGTLTTVTPLTSAQTEPATAEIFNDPNFEVVRALSEVNSLAWSPDSQRLAFMGAMEGPSVDLYVYTLADGSITRLTDGDSQAIHPTWSPDGKWIVHVAVDSLGTGAGYALQGVWAAAADGSENKLLYEPQSGDEEWVTWTGPDTLLLYSWSAMCGPESLRKLTISTGDVQVVWAGPFSMVAADPATGMALLTVDQYTAECGVGSEMGTFLVDAAGTWQKVDDADSYLPVWSEAAGAFYALAGGGAIEVSPAGQVTPLTSPISVTPAVSPDGAYYAWASSRSDESGLWISGQDEAVTNVTLDPVLFPIWTPDGRRLFFFGGGSLFAAGVPDFAPRLVVEGLPYTNWQPVWVAP